MIPAKINTTGNDAIDTELATLAIHLRNSGMSELQAVAEALRIRDAFLGAAVDALTRMRGYPQLVLPEELVTELRGLTGNFGCRCTGFDGCPNPSGCGTPNGCHCGAY
jgi:hypothetical protein